MLFVTVHSQMLRYRSINFNVNQRFFWRNMKKRSTCWCTGPCSCRKFETMSLEIGKLLWIHESNIITSWKRCPVDNTLCSVTTFFYHHSVMIQHLVSDKLFSLQINKLISWQFNFECGFIFICANCRGLVENKMFVDLWVPGFDISKWP
jgi:hypothetical protein